MTADRILSPVNSRFLSDIHCLVTVDIREDSWKLTIVDVGSILGLTRHISVGKGYWQINRQINLRTFKEVFCEIGYRG